VLLIAMSSVGEQRAQRGDGVGEAGMPHSYQGGQRGGGDRALSPQPILRESGEINVTASPMNMDHFASGALPSDGHTPPSGSQGTPPVGTIPSRRRESLPSVGTIPSGHRTPPSAEGSNYIQMSRRTVQRDDDSDRGYVEAVVYSHSNPGNGNASEMTDELPSPLSGYMARQSSHASQADGARDRVYTQAEVEKMVENALAEQQLEAASPGVTEKQSRAGNLFKNIGMELDTLSQVSASMTS
jgi:hypothetical protein